MPIPTPTQPKIPRQPGPSATPSAAPAKRPSSSSSSVSSSSRRHTSSPPTSRPTSSSRYSPPQTSRDRLNSSPLLSSRQSSKRGDRSPPLRSSNKMQKQDSDDDTAKMPPPPAPQTGRAGGLKTASKPGEKRRAASVSNKAKAEDEKASVATATGKGIGKLLSLKQSTSRSTAKGTADSEPAKRSLRSRAATVDKAPDKGEKTGAGESSGGSLGRTMSLRSATRATAGSGNGNGKVESSTSTRRTGMRPRPTSMYGATTSKSDLTGMSTGATTAPAAATTAPTTGPSGIKRPSSSSNSGSNTSIPPPPAPVKGHKKSSSVTSVSVQNSVAAAPTGVNPNSRPTTSGSTKSKRPAFTALNQDFSAPANPNPPTAPRSRAIPPAPLDTPTIHAQTQLLQLLTLHSASTAVYQQLITSATSTLKARFEKLSARHYDARETSLKKQKRHNLDSLAAVVNNVVPGKKRRDTTKSPEERVQGFSEGIKRIDAMRSGEFRRLCGVFGEWIAGYNPRAGSASREKWVDGIGEAWRRECVGISRRLEVSIAGVDGVAGVLADHGEEETIVTTVTRVAEGYKDLAEGMLEEVEMMRRMEVEVVERERMELKRRISLILDVGVDSSYNSVAVWAAC